MFNKNWRYKTAEDTLALGSIAFYFIVFARSLIGPYWNFVIPLVIAAVSLFVLALIIKKSENNLARAIVLVFFTVIFYNEIRFTILALLLLIIIILMAFYLRKDRISIFNGLAFGIISSAIGYWLSPYILMLLGLH